MDSNRKKNIIYSLVLLVLFVSIWWYRNSKGAQEKGDAELYKMSITGEAQGTTYQIKYLFNKNVSFKKPIDSILGLIDQSMSLWVKESEINRFNAGTQLKFELPYFYPVLKKSKEIYTATEGSFDPTVMPLVKAWGFGPDKAEFPRDRTIDSLLQFVNFDSIYFDSVSICKLKKGMQIDFNAIAQGYSADLLGEFLESQGIKNYMVELGGEVRCRGTNQEGAIWSIGISNPMFEEDGKALQAAVRLKDRSLATSGNYRKFYEKDGVKYSHTISPITGYPVAHTLLSASVFAPDAMTADGYATAFMVMGTDKAIEFSNKNPEMDVFLIYSDENGKLKTFISEGIKEFVFEVEGDQ